MSTGGSRKLSQSASDRSRQLHARASEISSGVQGPASAVETRPIESLIPYARNARTHSPEQVAQIAASIREWGWTAPVLIDRDGGIIAGHGRVMAARQLGMTDVPILVADGWSETKKRAYILADNKLALNAGWDAQLLSLELADLQELGADFELMGFDDSEYRKQPDPPGDDAETGQLGDVTFSVVVDCTSEQQQADLLAELEERGLTCRALML